MPYLNVIETNSLMELLELQNPGVCERIALPHQSFEGQTSYALRIRVGQQERRPGVLLIGGVHAREWGSTDILMFLAERLLEMSPGAPYNFGGVYIPGNTVQEILENLDLIFFPVVNPDGKRYSQAIDADWRKNRAPTSDPQSLGVDINRNFDFLWDFRRHFDPAALLVVSDIPANGTYHGPAPFSEPEARNVRHLLNENPHIRFFVDVHSYSGLLMYPWGDDDNQTTDPTMSFTNPQFDGLRGNLGDTGYREYMNPGDLSLHQSIVHRMGIAVSGFRGMTYEEGPKATTLYLTSGTSSDYAFSRHLANRSRPKIHSFLIEWGIDTGFQPPFSEMQMIIQEVAAGLMSLFVTAREMPLIEKSPDPLLFGNVAVGEVSLFDVQVRNVGTRTVRLTDVSVIGPGYQAGLVSGSDLAVDETATIRVFLQPQQQGPAHGALRFQARYLLNGGTADPVEVRLVGGSCIAGPGECLAPVFPRHSAAACVLISGSCALLIILLSLFGRGESVRCAIAKLRFRIEHCREGNGDPCIRL